MFLLARTYMLVEQTGEAKSLLSQIVRDNPSFVPGQLMLVQLLLREGNVKDAREHVNEPRQSDAGCAGRHPHEDSHGRS